VAVTLENTRRRIAGVTEAYWSDLLASRVGAPELFVFSDDDALVPAVDVTEFLERRRASGVDVHTLRLDHSPHVGHLRTAREAYERALDDVVGDGGTTPP